MDSSNSITSSLKPRKARHFPIASALPSVFSFRPHLSQACESTKHVCTDELRESIMFSLSSPTAHYQKLQESKGKRLQRRRNLCKEAFSGCIRKSTGVVHTVCMQPVTVETYLAFNKQAFLNDNQLCPHFLLKFSFRQRMLQLEFRNFENPNTNQKITLRKATDTRQRWEGTIAMYAYLPC